MYILIIAVEQVNIRDFRETYRYIFTVPSSLFDIIAVRRLNRFIQ